MPAYLLAGPAVALIGIVAIVFVMRHRSTEERSMYSSRRSQIQRKVQAARSRTLAPRGRGGKAPTEAEIAATQMAAAAPAYEAPVAPKQAWEMPAAPAAYATPPAEAPAAYSPPAYAPPAPPADPMPAPMPTFEPAAAPAAEPVWTPAPAEPSWNPAADATAAPAPPETATPAPQPASTPAGGGASWEIVGDVAPEQLEEPARGKGKDKDKDKDKDKRKEKAAAAAGAAGGAWSLASGEAAMEPGAEDEGEMVRGPNPAMAIAQYAVLVVGLVMVLIGVVVMVANSKVT